MDEYELASRYRDGTLWTYGDHASGDDSGACWDDGDILGGLGMSILFVDYAVYSGNSRSSTAFVKSKTANSLGLYDMSGNAFEWCFDWYPGNEGASRVLRDGDWGDNASYLRVGGVNSGPPYDLDDYIGFRFTRNP